MVHKALAAVLSIVCMLSPTAVHGFVVGGLQRKYLGLQIENNYVSYLNEINGVNGDDSLTIASEGIPLDDKRVTVTVRYSGGSGLRPFYLTFAKKVNAAFSDVVIERRILPDNDNSPEDATFEVLVDNKIVLGKKKSKTVNTKGRSKDSSNGRSIFVSMTDLESAINKAAKKRRPNTIFGDDASRKVRIDKSRSKTLSGEHSHYSQK